MHARASTNPEPKNPQNLDSKPEALRPNPKPGALIPGSQTVEPEGKALSRVDVMEDSDYLLRLIKTAQGACVRVWGSGFRVLECRV